MELVCTVTQDCDCPVEGDLLFWLVVNKFKKNYEGTSFCICSAYMCVYKVQFCIVLLTCSVFFAMSGSHILHILFCKYIFLLMIISPL